MAHQQQQQQQQTFLSSVKCEPRLDYRQHYAEATTTSSPWPSSPPMPDLVGGNPAHRAATAAGFLSSSMNFLAHVVTDSSGAAPSELYKLRPRDADTVQSLVSVLATTPASAAAGGRSPSPAPVVGALTHHHHHHHHAPTIPPAVEATPGLATTAHQFLATSSASCPVRPRALKRSKGSGPLAKSSSTTIPAPDMMTQPQHHHHHHHVQPSHPHHHYVAPHLSSSPSSASSSPPSPYAYSRPCPHSGLAAPSVLPVAPCQHHHQQLQQQHSPHPLHHHHHHHQHYPAPGMWLDQHQQHYQFYASHPPVPHHHPHHSHHSHHHGPHHQYYEAHSRPLFWSSSPGVVTRPTQTTPTTSRVASAELPAIPTVTSPASSASPTFAMQRKRRRSQSAPAPRDQLIVPALKIEEVEDNESSTNGGGNAFCSSPMAMSPLRPCSSSPPTSPASQEALSPTKRSDIYGLLN